MKTKMKMAKAKPTTAKKSVARKSTTTAKKKATPKSTTVAKYAKGGCSKSKSGKPMTKKYEIGGASESECWPGKPGCNADKARRINKRRKAMHKLKQGAGKVIGGILGAAAVGTAGYLGAKKSGILDK